MATSTSLPLLLFITTITFIFFTAVAGPVAVEFIYPNFTATAFHFVDTSGTFLSSPNSVFHAAILHLPSTHKFYLVVVHSPSNAAVWSANRNSPVTSSSNLTFTHAGLSLTSDDGKISWSTPANLSGPVSALQLTNSGNLRLLGPANTTLWQSFDHPTDTLLPGQNLYVNSSLVSAVSDADLAEGDHQLVVTPRDARLVWKESQVYWSLSMDSRSSQDHQAEVEFMAINASGIFLYSKGGDGSLRVVFQVIFSLPAFWIATLDSGGRFTITSYAFENSSSAAASTGTNKFIAPNNDCGLPAICMPLEICAAGPNGSRCACPPPLEQVANSGECSMPISGATVLSNPSSGCDYGADNISFISLGDGIDYFANRFKAFDYAYKDFQDCRNRCSANCSCRGFFYKNSSGSCYLLNDDIGSFTAIKLSDYNHGDGYIKVIIQRNSSVSDNDKSSSIHLAAILLPIIAAILSSLILGIMGFAWWKRKKRNGYTMDTLISRRRRKNASPSPTTLEIVDGEVDDDEIFIPDLPTRFNYEELQLATGDFGTLIGTGGFGEVFKGVLPDGTPVAVKKIINLVDGGARGRREFCTEIAVIGNIRHVNLVRLRGFCAQGPNRLLVYEYMSRGSLDRCLFGSGPVLEWAERVEIALGAARGLAYLHSGCEHKIVHCDVKPENILLHDTGPAKLSDFGLAKLLSRDQSGRFTTMRGTRGYLAPEWLSNSAISDKTDVYSFGMVLLEIVRGRRNWKQGTDSHWSGSDGLGSPSDYFPMAVLEMHKNDRYMELADPRLKGRVQEDQIRRMVKTALCCLNQDPAMRPTMANVASMIEGSVQVTEPPIDALSFLRVYGARSFTDNILQNNAEEVSVAESISVASPGEEYPILHQSRPQNIVREILSQ